MLGSMLRSWLPLACLTLAVVTRVHAQDAPVPEPPPALDPAAAAEAYPPTCHGDAEWVPAEGCMRHVDDWEPGPSAEMVGGTLALFGVGYVVQALSTAVSVAQGQHDVGLAYSAERLGQYERWGYAPLLGPWAKLALAPPHVDSAGALLFACEGLLELGGAVLFLVSLFVHPVNEWRRDPAGPWRITPTARGLTLEWIFG